MRATSFDTVRASSPEEETFQFGLLASDAASIIPPLLNSERWWLSNCLEMCNFFLISEPDIPRFPVSANTSRIANLVPEIGFLILLTSSLVRLEIA